MKDYREMAEDVLRRRDAYLEERRRRMKKTVSVVCSVCFVLLLGAGAWRWSGTAQNPAEELDGGGMGGGSADLDGGGMDASGMDGDPAGYSAGDYAVGKQSDAQAGNEKESMGETDPLDGPESNCDAPPPSGQGDEPASESPVSAGNIKAYEKAWGGCYLDGEGRTVVWLTEDTPQNRQKVFEMNPNLLESSTLFREADYSLKYLTKLQEAISEMMAEGQLPFVTVSALMEEENRIRVTVTTEDPGELEKLLAVDSLGGAIVTERASGGAVTEKQAVEE